MHLKNRIPLILVTFLIVACSSKKKEDPKPAPVSPTISNFVISPKHIDDPVFKLQPPVSQSTGAFTYTSDNPLVAVVHGDSVIIKGTGSANITATQAAVDNFTSGSITANFVVSANVYIAGYTSGPNGWEAFYLKNGVKNTLNGAGVTQSIYIHNKDVYVTGAISKNHIYPNPAYWKNGIHTIFPGKGQAFAIAVLGDDVYVAGYVYPLGSGSPVIATLWKNGIATTLKNISACCGRVTSSSQATGIAIHNNEVYVCGYASDNAYGGSAMIWKPDGTVIAYSKPAPYGFQDSSSFATKIIFHGDDMYVAGFETNSKNLNARYLTYWKNGVPFTLATDTKNYSIYNDIAVNDQGVYTVGVNENAWATVWKNGIETPLLQGSEAKGIAIQNNDIYVVGDTYTYTPGTSGTYSPLFFINGVNNSFPAPANTFLTGITIVDH